VRHGLVPALRAVHPGAERNVVRTAALLRDEAAVLDAAVAQALDPGGDRISRERLRDLPPALQRLVLIHLAESAAPAGAFVPAAAQRLADVLAAPEGAAVAIEGGTELVIEDGHVSARRQRPIVRRP
jgi:tRNA(Ile)-lysidine synthase